MHVTVESHEVIFGDDYGVKRSVRLADQDVEVFLEELYRYLYQVDCNRSCHRCSEACQHALTLHFGRPFSQDFYSGVPT